MKSWKKRRKKLNVCVVCEKEIRTMIRKYTRICSENCQKENHK